MRRTNHEIGEPVSVHVGAEEHLTKAGVFEPVIAVRVKLGLQLRDGDGHVLRARTRRGGKKAQCNQLAARPATGPKVGTYGALAQAGRRAEKDVDTAVVVKLFHADGGRADREVVDPVAVQVHHCQGIACLPCARVNERCEMGGAPGGCANAAVVDGPKRPCSSGPTKLREAVSSISSTAGASGVVPALFTTKTAPRCALPRTPT